jgi:hypothetical protein
LRLSLVQEAHLRAAVAYESPHGHVVWTQDRRNLSAAEDSHVLPEQLCQSPICYGQHGHCKALPLQDDADEDEEMEGGAKLKSSSRAKAQRAAQVPAHCSALAQFLTATRLLSAASSSSCFLYVCACMTYAKVSHVMCFEIFGMASH